MSYIGNLPFGKTLRTVTSATANGSATVFYPDGGYDVNFVDVFVSGARLTSGLDYTASDGISITLLYTPADGDTIDMVAYGLLELVSPVFPTSISVGSNVVINTSSISVGNSSVNTQIVAGNVTLNGSTLKVGNSSVNTVITGNSVTIGGTLTVTGNVALTTNSVNSSMLTTTGVIANSYGNTTAIPVITVDAAGRITNATTSSVSGVTGLSFTPANSTITVSTSTTNFDAVITSGNDSVQGLLKVIDSVSNTSVLIAGSANSVTTAYLLAANAVSNATAYAATAYSNAVATAASDATTKAGTAYSNAVSVAASDATTKAGTAYSNAVATAASDATSKAGTAYSNATAYADTKAGTAYSNATAYADTKAGTAYSNAISYANTAAGTAYSNAASYADTKAAAAYSNVFNGGTFSGAVVMQANLTANSVRMNGDLQIDGNLTVSGNTVSIYVSSLNVEDNMIYLNSNSTVSHPDLGFAGNYNDGSYKHAGLFRDATDGVWKFFHGYTPEPDASVYIDTSNASFTFSNLQINYVIGNVTGSANSATYLGGNTAATLRSYSDTMAGTAYSNATTYAATIAGTAYSNAVSVAASDATTKAGTAYSNATTYAATIAGTAYSNAVSVAASDATTKAGTAYSNATTYAATIAGTAYSNATSYAATIAGTAYSNAVAYAASNSYVNSTFLKLTGGSLTGNVATSAYIHANGTGGATGGYFGMVKIGYGASYGTVERTDGDLYLQNNNAYNVVAGYGGGYLTATNSSRAPIFYDSNDTAYYTDPNSLSALSRLRVYGGDSSTPTQTIQAGVYPMLDFNSDSADANNRNWRLASVYNSYGHFQILSGTVSGGAATTPRLTLSGLTGHLSVGSVVSASYRLHVSGTGYATDDFRSPIFYDSDNTAYYTNPAGVSVVSDMRINDGNVQIITGNVGRNTKWRTLNGTTDVGISLYNAQDVWCMQLYANAGTEYGFLNGNWASWDIRKVPSGNLYLNGNGTYYVNGSEVYMNRVYGVTDIRSPLYYDNNDTGYYVDPNGTSLISSMLVGLHGGTVYNTAGTGRIYFGSNRESDVAGYSIWTGLENYNGNYTKLTIDWHTGIRIGADKLYGGTRFYNSDIAVRAGTKILGVGETDNNVRVYGDIRSAIYYDLDNTSYYLNPNGFSQLLWLRLLGDWNTSGVHQETFTIRGTYPSMTFRCTNGTAQYWLLHNDAGSTMNFYGGTGDVDGVSWNRNFYIDQSGNITARGNVTAYSDIRLKTNIEVIGNALEKVKQLRGVYFDWIESGDHSIGVIAQEVEKIIPEVVSQHDSKQPGSEEITMEKVLSVDYGKITPLLIEAIKEQQQQIEELKSLVNKLIGS